MAFNNISASVVALFIKFTQKFNRYSIFFGGVSGEAWLLGLTYKCRMDTGKGNSPTFYITFTQKRYFPDDLRGGFELGISNGHGLDDASLHLTYELDDNGDEAQLARVKAILDNLHSNTEDLSMTWVNRQYPIAEYVGALLDTTHTRLKTIRVFFRDLFDDAGSKNLPPRAPYIKRLLFEQISIDDSSLTLLSTDFPTLDSLELYDCSFEDMINYGEMNTNMPYTPITTLTIRAEEIIEEMVLLSVYSMEDNISEYYIIDTAKNDLTLPTTKAIFEQLRDDLDSEKCILVNVSAEVIKNVSFTTSISVANLKLKFPSLKR